MKYTAVSTYGKRASRFMLMTCAAAMALGQMALATVPEAISVNSSNQHYSVGDNLLVNVMFSTNVVVTGSPTLELDLGENREMQYRGGSGSTNLAFRHVVVAGDFSPDLEVTSEYALQLNPGGSIKSVDTDEDWQGAIPAGGAAGSLKANTAITVGTATLTLSGDTTVQQGVTTWTVTRDVSMGDVAIELVSANTNVATVISEVEILDGDFDAPFDVTAVAAGGPVLITASSTNDAYESGTQNITFEPVQLTLSGDTTVKHGETTTWTVTRDVSIGGVTIVLTSGSTNFATVPATVIIPNGSYSAPFDVTGAAPGGPVSIDASSTNVLYQSGTEDITVEAVELTLSGATDVKYGETTTWTVTRDVSIGEVTIELLSADTNVASVSSSVIMSNGVSSVPFDVTGVAVGAPVLITASNTNDFYQLASKQISVELGQLTLSGAGTVQMLDTKEWKVTRVGSVGVETISLASADTSVATVQTAVVSIPDGAYDAVFDVTAVAAGGPVEITASNASYVVDYKEITVVGTNTPFVKNVKSTDDDYAIGRDITVTVTFTEPVAVDDTGGSPTLELELGENRKMTLDGATGATLDFVYTVQSGDFSPDLDVRTQHSLKLNGATIKSVASSNVCSKLIPVGTDDPNSLASMNEITVGTAHLTLTGSTSVEQGGYTTWTVTRDVTVGDLTVDLESATPGVASVPATVNIIDGDESATFQVTGVADGGPVTVTASAGLYELGTRDVTVIGKTLSFVGPVGSNGYIDEGSMEEQWKLLRTDTNGAPEITLSASVSGSIVIPDQVSFVAGDVYSLPFPITALDDSPAPSGVDITATAPAGSGYNSRVQRIHVRNVPPTISSTSVPTNGMTVGISDTFFFSATDPANTTDAPTRDEITGRWDFGDGTVIANVPVGTRVGHTYTASGEYTVDLTVSDDGGLSTQKTFPISVDAGKALTVTVLTKGYPGIGSGTTEVTIGDRVVIPTTNGIFWCEEGKPATIRAIADTDSVVFQWGGDVPDGFVDTHTVGPSGETTLTVTMDGDKNISLLFAQMAAGGGSDLDDDDLDDDWEVSNGLDPTTQDDPNGKQDNPDGDYLPGVVDVDNGSIRYAWPDDPLDKEFGYMPDPDHAFHNFFEYAGFDGTNGTDDDPHTHPMKSDTDDDGLGDGWEYYFWGNAVLKTGMTGRAYDPLNITNSIVISNEEIQTIFNPTVSGGADLDPDNDGWDNVEEMIRGTSPIDWDTDGDGMPDSWEDLRGLLPLDRTDGGENPDDDWMAEDANANQHFDVYQLNGFDPRTGWAQNYYNEERNPALQVNTREYQNLDEFLVAQYLLDYGYITNAVPDEWHLTTTDPLSIDTDEDGMADGWELYVNLMPVGFYFNHPSTKLPDGMTSASDADIDLEVFGNLEGDGLSNLAEFRCYDLQTEYPSEFPVLDAAWKNKFWTTDPWNFDTDDDQILDGDEGGVFVYDGGDGSTNIVEGSFAGGGLNPCSSDTDEDALPDGWEMLFAYSNAVGEVRDGMDGTVQDATGLENDYDGDGLENYQEYWVNAVYHFQYECQDPTYPAWQPGLGFQGYDPADFFEGIPYFWDWHARNNDMPYTFILATRRPGPNDIHFACTDPRMADSDRDGMDDYYELYHGLNPIYGTRDIVTSWEILATLPDHLDIRAHPWRIGSQAADPDQDGLTNDKEALVANIADPQRYHTDPTPLWITDHSYELSWVNLYYWTGTQPWYWDSLRDPPAYVFDFESNEGFDTDNDGIQDHQELVSDNSVGATNPLDDEAPVKRRALKLDGTSAARTRGQFWHGPREYETFTVEAWVRPEVAASGSDQVVVEKPINVPNNNPPWVGGIRLNFRLAIDATGHAYALYHGSGYDPTTSDERVTSTEVLEDNEWVHLAAAYDADNGGSLRIYIDGDQSASVSSGEIPVNGWFSQHPQLMLRGPVVVGAADNNPDGYVANTRILVGPKAGRYPGDSAEPNQPALDLCFKGWIDEVRLWNGTRTENEIRGTMLQRMRREDVITSQQGPGAAELTDLWTFDDLPDPDHDPVAPFGFDLLSGRPDDGSYPGIPWWSSATDRSRVYDNYHYIPWIANAAAEIPRDPPYDSQFWTVSGTDTNGAPVTNEFPNASNPYTFQYNRYLAGTTANHGGDHFDYGNDDRQFETSDNQLYYRLYGSLLPLGYAEADEDVELWDGGGTGRELFDSDGDGMDDAWEERNGLDPHDATGRNGAYGDEDGDGLNNMSEYRAGTEPLVRDTDGDGMSDFYTWSGTVYRVYGEVFTDFDGMDDEWERDNGLSPTIFDAYMDADDDGWDNLSEFMVQSNPQSASDNPEPVLRGSVLYNGDQSSGATIIEAYQEPEMDGTSISGASGGGGDIDEAEVLGVGDGSTKVYAGELQYGNIQPGTVRVRRLNPGWVTPDYDFGDDADGNWILYPNYFNSVDANDMVEFDYETGEYSFSWPDGSPNNWDAPWANDSIFIDYTRSDDDPSSYRVEGLTQGDVFLFAYLDRDGNGTWNDDEAAGLCSSFPIRMSWGDVSDVDIGLTDDVQGFARFSWEAVDGQYEYPVTVVNQSGGNAPQVFAGTIRGRTYVHEGDFINAGFTALPHGSYKWYVYDSDGSVPLEDGTFNCLYDATHDAPQVVYPSGAELHSSKETFRWTMSDNATHFRLQISTNESFSELVLDVIDRAPFVQADGSSRYDVYVGDADLSSGLYFWRVQGRNPRVNSAFSTTSRFTVNLEEYPSGPYGISGELKYFGKVTNGNFVIEFYPREGFGGVPDAIITMANTASSNDWPINSFPFEMKGLSSGDYYVRGFLDQDGDGVQDDRETKGYIEDSAYVPSRIIVPLSASSRDLFLTLADTDNDHIADDWEYMYAGDLVTMGPGTKAKNGINTDYECYAATPMNVSPLDPDAALADGVSFRIKDALGISWSTDLRIVCQISDISQDAEGRVVITWNQVGSDTSVSTVDGAAEETANGKTLRYEVQFSAGMHNWVDAAAHGSLSYDAVAGEFRFVDNLSTNKMGYYRYRTTWSE